MSGPGFFGLLEAAKRYRAGGPGPKATLMALMEHMGQTEEGWVCWPTMAALAFETEQDPGTVRRHIARFEACGLIERRARGKEGGGRGSNLFVVDVEVLTGAKRAPCAGEQTAHPEGANRASEGEQTAHSGEVAPYKEHPVELPRTTTARASNDGTSFSFDGFWNHYPLRVGKQAAKRAWDKATRRVPPAVIVQGAIRYAADPNRDQAFTAHPATWLNAGRWDDDPLPPRSNGNGSVGARTVANVNAMHQRRSLGPPPAARRELPWAPIR